MSNAPSPDPAPDASSPGESPDDDPDAPDPADDEPSSGLRTALGALRARLSPAPKDDDQPDD